MGWGQWLPCRRNCWKALVWTWCPVKLVRVIFSFWLPLPPLFSKSIDSICHAKFWECFEFWSLSDLFLWSFCWSCILILLFSFWGSVISVGFALSVGRGSARVSTLSALFTHDTPDTKSEPQPGTLSWKTTFGPKLNVKVRSLCCDRDAWWCMVVHVESSCWDILRHLETSWLQHSLFSKK